MDTKKDPPSLWTFNSVVISDTIATVTGQQQPDLIFVMSTQS